MFENRKNRSFARDALIELGDEFARILGEDGEDCYILVCGSIDRAAKSGEIPDDFLQLVAGDLRKKKARTIDAAIAYLDAAITFVKRLCRDEIASNPEYKPVVDMEKVLDTMFLQHKSPIIPRNGRAGPALAEFSNDPRAI